MDNTFIPHFHPMSYVVDVRPTEDVNVTRVVFGTVKRNSLVKDTPPLVSYVPSTLTLANTLTPGLGVLTSSQKNAL